MIFHRRDAEFAPRIAEKNQNLGASPRHLGVSAVKSFTVLISGNLG
jgi:hypothetical protein